MADDFSSVSALVKSMAHSSLEGLRRNKLPAALSAVALALTTALAMTSDFDERPRYRRFVLPAIEKAEQQFLEAMSEAEQTPNDLWRVGSFIWGHRRAKGGLRTHRLGPALTGHGRD